MKALKTGTRLLIAVLLSAGLGCAYVKSEHIEACQEICKDNSGLHQVVTIGSSGSLTCECVNGMEKVFNR